MEAKSIHACYCVLIVSITLITFVMSKYKPERTGIPVIPSNWPNLEGDG